MVRPRVKVTIDSLQEIVYEKSIGTKMNDLDLCLEVVYGYVSHWHCVTFAIEYLETGWFHRTTNRKWSMGNRMVTGMMTSRDPERSSRDPMRLMPNISKTAGECFF